MPFGLGAPELIIILVIVLVIFGAGKLPQVFGSLGRGVREFREASEGREEPATDSKTTTTSTETKSTRPETADPNSAAPVASASSATRDTDKP